MTSENTNAKFFERMYRRDPDPWRFGSSKYERGRYTAILRTLAGRRYRRGFEPGCSVGVLTQGLATLCDDVEAMDLSSTAVAEARHRCFEDVNVHLTVGAVQGDIPAGTFDLIVLSEIGYYFEENALLELGRRLTGRLDQGGTLLAAHWLGVSSDHVLSGDSVHAVLAALDGLERVSAERHAGFRLDCWRKR